ncbi:Cathepsin W [Toxocara canis]|uniref:Cathepsin W n=1 Tax=Toxocara canis TaxID=6265 RepID=A0A0B2V7K7_TOXCA|nr:Cathepsin W [Toxocara canis]
MIKLALMFFSFGFPTFIIESKVIRLWKDAGDELSPETMFTQFILLNNKSYANDEETTKRLAIFKRNLAYIRSLNTIYNGSIFGITRFADHTTEELHKLSMKLPEQFSDDSSITYAKETGMPIPTYFDWRDKLKVTPVKDQGECNACWAFASASVVETLHAIKTNETTDLSEQQLIDCDVYSDGCRFGYPATAYLVAKRQGLLRESQLSYRGIKEATCPAESGSVFVESIQKIKPNADAIADYVHNFGPVSVNLRITTPLYHYTTGIFRPNESECEASNDYHVWTIVGFGVHGDQPYWIIKNSWGTNWGEEGYVYFVRGENACGIESYPYSATV